MKPHSIPLKKKKKMKKLNLFLERGKDKTKKKTIDFFKLINTIKKEEEAPHTVLNSNSKGIVFSEGATFFALEKDRKESTYAKVEDIVLHNVLKESEVESFVTEFLKSNNLVIEDIDAVVFGNNGDITFDLYYDIATSIFKHTPQLFYKHLCGEFNTASGFGLWLASHVLKNQEIPEIVQMNKMTQKSYSKVLLYNQYQGKDHSLILLTK